MRKKIFYFYFLKEEKIYFKVSSAVVVISPLTSSALWAYLIGDELIIYFLLFTIIDFDICMKCQNLFSGETKNKKKKRKKKNKKIFQNVVLPGVLSVKGK